MSIELCLHQDHKSCEIIKLCKKRSKDNERKRIFTQRFLVTLTFNLVSPKSIQIIFSPRPISMCFVINSSPDNELQTFLFITEVSSDPCNLDLWPCEPKINRRLVLTKTNHTNTKAQKPFGLPTDGPRDRPTLAKQYAPFSLKRGIIKQFSVWVVHSCCGFILLFCPQCNTNRIKTTDLELYIIFNILSLRRNWLTCSIVPKTYSERITWFDRLLFLLIWLH